MRVNVSTVWDLASKLGDLVGEPYEIVDAEQRPIERGKESSLSASQLARVYINAPPLTTNEAGGRVATPATITAYAAFADMGGSIGFGAQESTLAQRESEMRGVVDWLIQEAEYRWGPAPGIAFLWFLASMVLVTSGVATGLLAARAGHALAIAPLLAAGVITVLALLTQRSWRIAERLLVSRRGQLIDARPREEIAKAREASRASWRDKLRGAAVGIATSFVIWFVLRVLLQIHGS